MMECRAQGLSAEGQAHWNESSRVLDELHEYDEMEGRHGAEGEGFIIRNGQYMIPDEDPHSSL